MTTKMNLEEVKKVFSDAGMILLAKSYSNSQTSMPCLCICGKTHNISLNYLKIGKRCPDAAN